MPASDKERPIALVTGASSGLGASYASRLAEQGHDLVLVARRRERLEDLATRLRSSPGAKAEVLVADLTDGKGLSDVESRASRGDLEVLVNNAGFAGYRPFVTLEPAVAENLIRLHILAVTRLTRAGLPGMAQRKQGAIINVASLLSLSGSIPANPMPYRATYAAAKAYILTFTQALAGELKDSGVRVQVCLPGVIATEFHDQLNLNRDRLATMAMQPDDVVAASLTALERNEVICVPGLEDSSLIDQLTASQRAVLDAANSPRLASRYKTASPKR